ncbi:hypothetical protein CLOM_g19744 [Closterium sp. NIES-68]|nr:hypothetical protein CLOM_g19744 [Closterium sp. NIES-68]
MELLDIRAHRSQWLRERTLATAVGVRIKNGRYTDQPAILAFVSSKVHPNWLPPDRLLPPRLDGEGSLWCHLDVLEFACLPGGQPSVDRARAQELSSDLVDDLRGCSAVLGPGSQVACDGTFATMGPIVINNSAPHQLGFLTNCHVAGSSPEESEGRCLYHPHSPSHGPGVPVGEVRRVVSFRSDFEWFGFYINQMPDVRVRVDGAFAAFAPSIRVDQITMHARGVPGEVGPLLEISPLWPVTALVSHQVAKVGRSSGLTCGTVMAYAIEYYVDCRRAYASDLLIRSNNDAPFDLEGDAGSTVYLQQAVETGSRRVEEDSGRGEALGSGRAEERSGRAEERSGRAEDRRGRAEERSGRAGAAGEPGAAGGAAGAAAGGGNGEPWGGQQPAIDDGEAQDETEGGRNVQREAEGGAGLHGARRGGGEGGEEEGLEDGLVDGCTGEGEGSGDGGVGGGGNGGGGDGGGGGGVRTGRRRGGGGDRRGEIRGMRIREEGVGAEAGAVMGAGAAAGGHTAEREDLRLGGGGRGGRGSGSRGDAGREGGAAQDRSTGGEWRPFALVWGGTGRHGRVTRWSGKQPEHWTTAVDLHRLMAHLHVSPAPPLPLTSMAPRHLQAALGRGMASDE